MGIASPGCLINYTAVGEAEYFLRNKITTDIFSFSFSKLSNINQLKIVSFLHQLLQFVWKNFFNNFLIRQNQSIGSLCDLIYERGVLSLCRCCHGNNRKDRGCVMSKMRGPSLSRPVHIHLISTWRQLQPVNVHPQFQTAPVPAAFRRILRDPFWSQR